VANTASSIQLTREFLAERIKPLKAQDEEAYSILHAQMVSGRRKNAKKISFSLNTKSLEVLQALLKLDLPENQRRTINGFLNADPDKMISTPKEAYDILEGLVAKAQSQNIQYPFEVQINGRWYPVTTSVQWVDDPWMGDATHIQCAVRICDFAHGEHSRITEWDFKDGRGTKYQRSVRQILAEKGFRPADPNFNLQEYQTLVYQAEQLNSKFGVQYNLRGSAVSQPVWRWMRGLQSTQLGTPDSPHQVLTERLLETNTDDMDFYEEQNLPNQIPYVRVFSLKRKRYFYADVRDLTPYNHNVNAVNNLVLPEEMRSLLHTVFQANVTSLFGDISVNQKHGGMVILASGPPGVGKTMTAEVFAEMTKRPLYTMEIAELGVDVNTVEENLQRVFARATRWNAVLLLDEADIFMAKRDMNMERSAIVGIFLRLLDYYPGMLFLTTNRTDILDEAFASRITLSLDYPKLEVERRAKVWRTMFEKAGLNLDGGTFDALAGQAELNGRQIRNAVRLLRLMHPKRETVAELTTPVPFTMAQQIIKYSCRVAPQQDDDQD
jgi:SpoVK/Ycf46/Vps4 family AAA+-type ATPase